MATKLSLYNRVLKKVSELKINGLGEDSVNRRDLDASYDDDRKIVLEMHSWKFARRLVELAEVSAPGFGYTRAFQLPNDFISIVFFNDTDVEYRERKYFDIIGQELHTSEDSAKIIYIRDLDDPGLFSGGFVEALSTYMARNIAYSKTKSQPLIDRLDEMFERSLAKAKRTDAGNDSLNPVALSAYPNLNARLGRRGRWQKPVLV